MASALELFMSGLIRTRRLAQSSRRCFSALRTSKTVLVTIRCASIISGRYSVGYHVDLQGFEYSRSGNPNRNALESTLASLESAGAHALAFSSGSATIATVLQSLGTGAHVLSVNDVYGGTRRYMTQVAGAQGLEVSFLDLE